MTKYRLWRAMKIAVVGVVAIGAVSFIVMGLWNELMPTVFAVRTISFWQALGLLVLSKLLFGGFRPSGAGPRWRRRMMDRWEQMTPEERQKFKEGIRRNCRGERPEGRARANEATVQA